MDRLIPTILVALLLAGTALAYNGGHEPFPPDAKVPQIKLTALEPQSQEVPTGAAAKRWRYVLPGDKTTQLVVTYEDGLFFAQLTVDGQTALKTSAFSDFDNFDDGPYAFTADLNRDEKPDLAVFSRSGGCGLASGYTNIGFILSTGDGYRLTSVTTIFPDESDFVILDGKPCFVRTSFERVEQCNDGKPHNFWVYNLMTFGRDDMKVSNSIQPGFPKTIYYSFKPSHTETTIISDAQRKQIQKSALDGIFWKKIAPSR